MIYFFIICHIYKNSIYKTINLLKVNIMGFKENLREEIKYQGLMLKEVALAAGLNQSSLNNYLRENASIPSADIAVRIAKVLGVSVEYLVTGEKSPPCFSNYPAEIRTMAEKISKMSIRDRRHVSALVNAIAEE